MCPMLKSSFEDEDGVRSSGHKKKIESNFLPNVPRYPKEHWFVFGSQNSPACRSATYLPT